MSEISIPVRAIFFHLRTNLKKAPSDIQTSAATIPSFSIAPGHAVILQIHREYAFKVESIVQYLRRVMWEK